MRIQDDRERKELLDEVAFNDEGLIAAIAQDVESQCILMLAWMNRDALNETLKTGQVVYYSRSRQCLWRKGESSGQTQQLKTIRMDCDKDALVLGILQQGVACHTGRRSCFSWAPVAGTWTAVEAVETDPASLYGEKK
jgi:phosphoribosyl-AMP cyclohydrolase